MTGSLQIKGNKYYAVLNLKDCSGKRKPKWISTNISAVKGNKKKATAALNQIIAEYEDKVHAGKEAPLFTEYIARWLELEKSRIQQSTWESYECYCRKHIIPYFVPLGLTVDKVTSAHIKAYYDTKSVGGRGDNRKGGLSHSSLKNHSKVLKQVLNSAVIDEYISKNVATRVPIPKLATDTNESKAVFLNTAEANKLLSAFKEHRLQPLLYVTLYYGLRRSEILGLKWDAIDFENKTITIQHVVVKNGTIVAKDRTKSVASKRTFALLPEVSKVLKQIKTEQEKNKQLCGTEYEDQGYVFTWDNGVPYRPDYVTKAFQTQLKKCGFKHMRFHDLRHSCASILYDKGWGLKDIQEWLGHADIETTGNIYTHISKDRQRILAQNLSNTFTI